jgi:hypothetical protein
VAERRAPDRVPPRIRPERRRARDAQGVVRVRVHVGRQGLPLRDGRDVAQRPGNAAPTR